MSGPFKVERMRDPRDVLRVSEPLEPKTVLLSSAAIGAAFPNRAWRVRDAAGRDAAFVVCERWCTGRWVAYTLLLDPESAPIVADVLARSRARAVDGAAENIEPLLPYLKRATAPLPMYASSADRPAAKSELRDFPVDPRVRLATTDDLEQLVDLYKDYELNRIPTIPRLRKFLRRTLARGPIIVMEEDGKLTAAMRADARSNRFLYWSGQTVRPEYRGAARGQALYGFLNKVHHDLDIGGVQAAIPNPGPRPQPVRRLYEDEDEGLVVTRDTWLAVQLGSRRWLPIPYRPRRLWYMLAGPTTPRQRRR